MTDKPMDAERTLRRLKAAAIAAEFPDDVSAINWFHDAVREALREPGALSVEQVQKAIRYSGLSLHRTTDCCGYIADERDYASLAGQLNATLLLASKQERSATEPAGKRGKR